MPPRPRLATAVSVALLLCLGAAPALHAQDGDATAEGDVTDVKPAGTMAWTLGDTAMAYVTTSAEMDTTRIGSVAVYPVEAEGAPPRMALEIGGFQSVTGGGSLFIYAEFDKDPAQDAVITLAQYQPDPGNLPVWTNDGNGIDPVTVYFETWDFDGKTGRIAGRFVGDLCKAAEWEAPPDLGDCVVIDGTFDSEVFAGL